jgi:opacity protein-like surface antigen
MKKIVLTVAVFALTLSTAFSQDFKPKEKEIAVGIAFDSPFSSGKPFSLINGLSGRYFYKSDLAFRGGLNIASNSSSKSTYEDKLNETTKESVYTKTQTEDISNLNLDLFLGAEKHFSGTDRLDPYAGADLLIGFENISSETNRSYKPEVWTGEVSKKQTNTSFGLRLVVGADYYVLPKVYIGTEFGLTYRYTSNGDETTINKVVDKDDKTKLIEKTTVKPGDEFGSASSILTDMTTASFRLGFRF